MKEKMKRLLAVAVPLLMGLTLFTAVAYGAYLLGGVMQLSDISGSMLWWEFGCFEKSPEHP